MARWKCGNEGLEYGRCAVLSEGREDDERIRVCTFKLEKGRSSAAIHVYIIAHTGSAFLLKSALRYLSTAAMERRIQKYVSLCHSFPPLFLPKSPWRLESSLADWVIICPLACSSAPADFADDG